MLTSPGSLFFLSRIPRFAAGRRLSCCGLALSGVLVALISLGCDRPEGIREYTINTRVPDALRREDRMLAAIIPGENAAWFFKAVGPRHAVDTVEPQVRRFVESVEFAGDVPELSELPEGWSRAGEKPMRFATLTIPAAGDESIELAVSHLPKSDDWDDQVAMNVNRWREQMKLPASTEQWAGAEPLPAGSADLPAVWVDLVGEMGAGPSMAGLAGGAADSGMPPSPGREPAAQPAREDTAQASGESDRLGFDMPPEWRSGKMSSMRLAAFEFGPEDKPAELTIIPAGGDTRGNVERWFGEIRDGKPPAEVVDAALEESQKLEISGREAQRFFLSDGREDSEESEAIDVTMIPLGDGFHLFVKARGPADTINDQRETIGQFLQSLKIPE